MSRAAYLPSVRPAPETSRRRRRRPSCRCRASLIGDGGARGAEEEAVREERRRIARELHDSAAQLIGAVLAHVQGTEELLAAGGPPEEARARLAVAATLAREGVSELRQTVCALRGAAEGAGARAASPHGGERLPEELERVVRLMAVGVPALAVRVRVTGRRRPLPPDAAAELLRIAQEAVANAVKHSGARRAEVRLEYAPGGAVTLRVADDGRGFDPAAARAAAEHGARFGLAGMGERAARIGALLSVRSAPGRGTHVVVRVAAAH